MGICNEHAERFVNELSSVVKELEKRDLKLQCDYWYNSKNHILSYKNAEIYDFNMYVDKLCELGFSVKETRVGKTFSFKALCRGDIVVFLNIFVNVSELRVVTEYQSKYFSYEDKTNNNIEVSSQISQIDQEDFGMSYAIRLKDGRYIIIDGGEEFVKSAERIYDVLKNGSPYKKPVIAAWFITHLHHDHHNCFNTFMRMFGGDVTVEKMLFSFPDADDYEQFPDLLKNDPRFKHGNYTETLVEFYGYTDKYEIPIYFTHTGQVYNIGNSVCEILSSQDDDTERKSINDFNNSSLVIRMTIENQIVLWCGDAYFENVSLAERYEEYLQCDILQVPHHGFPGGTIKGYEYIKPDVCLLPVSYFNAFIVFDTFNINTNFLMTKLGVKELITGSENRTITLPYTAKPYRAEELRNNYLEGRAANGSKSWCFSELNTGTEDDLCFSITNTCHDPATVYIDLYFERQEDRVLYIKAEVPPVAIKKINLKTAEGVDGEALSFNSFSLNKKGIPENSQFTARFISDFPVFVSKKGITTPYHSNFSG